MKITDAVELFLNDKSVYCAEASVIYYRDALRLYKAFLFDQLVEYTEQISIETNKQYVLYLRLKGIRSTSIQTYLRAVNNFCSWMIENKIVIYQKFKTKLPHADPRIILPLTEAEAYKIMAAISLHSQNMLRDLLIFRLMLDCGLRSSEVRHLRVCDVDLSRSTLSICNSKNYKNRILPLPEACSVFLRMYFQQYSCSGSMPLFIDQDGRTLSSSALKNFFFKLKQRSGVDRLHAHLLRHTFATSYMMSRNNIEYLRIYLGHSNYDVTRNYIHLASECLLTHYDIYRISSCFR